MRTLLLGALALLLVPSYSFATFDFDAYYHNQYQGEVLGASTELLTQDLYLGVRSAQVTLLQQFLNQNGFMVAQSGPGSIGQETDFMGPATVAALIKYQEAYAQDILWPHHLTKGTGSVYEKTRAHINNRLKAGVTPIRSTTGGGAAFHIAAEHAYVNPGTSLTLTAEGGVAPYTWKTTSGFLKVEGSVATLKAPRNVGTLTITLTDGTKSVATTSIKVVAKITHSTVNTVPGKIVTLRPKGGVPPYTYALLEGSGILTSVGKYTTSLTPETAVVRVTDTVGQYRNVHVRAGVRATTTATTTTATTTTTTTNTATTTGSLPVIEFSASPTSINQGQTATLSWSASEAVSCSLAPSGSGSATSGSLKVSPTQTTTYTLTCTNAQGTRTASVRVSVIKTATLPLSSASCSADIGGWTRFTPTPVVGSTPVERKSLTQNGSRIYYISGVTGDDATAQMYFWNGSNIVDENGSTLDANGNLYGTDPMNPSGKIMAFKRWAYVGPRRNATADIGSNAIAGEARPATRAGYPDWFLFKRGETFDLLDDALTFWKEKNPTYTGNGSNLNTGLSLSAGRSKTEPKLMSGYGDPCAPRPRFVHPSAIGFLSIYGTTYDPIVNHVAYVSLHIDGHDRIPVSYYAGITLLNQTTASDDILFEDMWIDGVSSNIQNEATITFRRSLITDAFGNGTGHVQGLFYGGRGFGARLRIEDSILMRNGFRSQDPQTFAWPPTGSNSWDIYNRNMYITGKVDTTGSWLRDSVSMLGASGDQFRGGRLVERNFFYQGYVTLGGYNGAYYATPEKSTGSFVNNVLQNFVGTGTNDNRGHPGWGLTLGGGSNKVEVANNIITNAAVLKNEWRAFGMIPASTDCVAGETNLKAPNKGNSIHDNIFDAGTAPSTVTLEEGVSDTAQVCLQATVPTLVGNTIHDNTMINANVKEYTYTTTAMASGTPSDTVFSNNALFKTRAEAASTLGWSDPNRTLKTYLQSQGVSVASSDGFPEYFALAAKMRKGSWDPRWTAKSINSYIRAGFGMPAL